MSLSIGRYPVDIGELWRFVSREAFHGRIVEGNRYRIMRDILFNIRLPRIGAAILIGSSLSVSGAVFQSMFVNPLVSPEILGVLAGASFGAALGMLLFKSWLLVQISALVFALIAVLASLGIASFNRNDRLLMLILGGIISGAMFTSLVSVVKFLADPNDQLATIVYWLMGGLSNVDGQTVLILCAPIFACLSIIFALSDRLNVLSLGDEEARSLGVNVSALRLLFIFLATVISALTVVMGGIIAWVGLLVPHLARMIVGPDNRVLLPTTALIGAIYLLIADDIARSVLSVEIPIGILTSLIGIPFFALVLRNAKRRWN
jgi:iron complex transport system permease protein